MGCPVGEQIYNGDMSLAEGCDAACAGECPRGWTRGTIQVGLFGVCPPNGSNCYVRATQVGGTDRWIKQVLTTPVLVECVTASSLKVIHYWGGAPSQSLRVKFYYTDATTSQHDYGPFETHTWNDVNLLSDLKASGAGKTLEAIEIIWTHTDNCSVDVDDVSISCGILISNSGGSLYSHAIDWRERQACRVAVRDVPLRTTGSFVDVGTYTLRNRRLNITIRLTDANKTTLQAIFDAVALVTITVRGWTYTGWFERKPIIYEYSVNNSGNREWVAEMEFVLSSFSYSP